MDCYAKDLVSKEMGQICDTVASLLVLNVKGTDDSHDWMAP